MVKIKDKITGKLQDYYIKYYKKGKLMADTRDIKKKKKNKVVEETLNKDLWDCPQCGKHSMEEVFFAGTNHPDGEPGLLCFVCHYMLSGEILEDYMTDEDGWREEL